MRSASRGFVAILAILALLSIGAASAVSSGTAHAAGTGTHSQSYSASRGHVQYMGTTSPSLLPVHSSAISQRTGTIPLRFVGGQHAAIVSHGAPSAASQKVSHTGSQLQNFDGVQAGQSAAVSGVDVEPPDEGLGAGNGFVFNLVNLAGIIYHTNGTVAAGPFSLSAFFAEPPAFTTVLISDPRVYFDPSSNRWFATELEFNLQTGLESHLDIAVSISGNPTGAYRLYRIDTTDPSGFECPCFSDYPILGIDHANLYISGNEFSISGPAFNGAEIFAISKSQLVAGATTPNFVRFGSLSIAGTLAYHIQPAITYGT
ncbi:MAG: hypothetical protein ACHQ4H_15565, partial [Ktedonobacterales bacterium]